MEKLAGRSVSGLVDPAAGHLAALQYLKTRTGTFRCNPGTGRGSSVLEVIGVFSRAAGRDIPYWRWQNFNPMGEYFSRQRQVIDALFVAG